MFTLENTTCKTFMRHSGVSLMTQTVKKQNPHRKGNFSDFIYFNSSNKTIILYSKQRPSREGKNKKNCHKKKMCPSRPCSKKEYKFMFLCCWTKNVYFNVKVWIHFSYLLFIHRLWHSPNSYRLYVQSRELMFPACTSRQPLCHCILYKFSMEVMMSKFIIIG